MTILVGEELIFMLLLRVNFAAYKSPRFVVVLGD